MRVYINIGTYVSVFARKQVVGGCLCICLLYDCVSVFVHLKMGGTASRVHMCV